MRAHTHTQCQSSFVLFIFYDIGANSKLLNTEPKRNTEEGSFELLVTFLSTAFVSFCVVDLLTLNSGSTEL